MLKVSKGPSNVARSVGKLLDGADREHYLAFYLDARHRIIADHTTTVAILKASLLLRKHQGTLRGHPLEDARSPGSGNG